MSLFELPVSPSARRAKMALVLVLDAVLLGAGVFMIVSYIGDRGGKRASEAAARPGRVEVLAPVSAPPREEPSRGGADGSHDNVQSGQPSKSGKPVDSGGKSGKPVDSDGKSGGTGPGQGTGRTDSTPAAESATPTAKTGSKDEDLAAGTSAGAGSGVLFTGSEGAEPSAEPGATGPDGAHDGGPEANVDDEIARMAPRLALQVHRRQGDLERCYQAASKSSGPSDRMTGRIHVRFTLMPDGSTKDAEITRDDIRSTALATCVLDRFRSWPMPAGVSQPIEIEWPFEFSPNSP